MVESRALWHAGARDLPPTEVSVKHALCYIRTHEEEPHELLGLEAQRLALQGYCAMRQLRIIDAFIDEGCAPQTPLTQRPGGSALCEAVDAGRAQAVVTLKLDRLFEDATGCLRQIEQWQAREVSLHVVDVGGQPMDTSAAMGQVMVALLRGVAELDRHRQVSAPGLQASLKTADSPGAIPYGYRIDAQGLLLEADPHEQEALARMYALHVQGVSVRRIAERLSAEGFKARGSRWHITTVTRLIKRMRDEASGEGG